ncbi:MAG: hypothetical protein WCO52_05405 [bacterium]
MRQLRLLTALIATSFIALMLPSAAWASAGIFASGGGTFTVGQSFTVTVTASGDSFDSVQGSFSVSGPVSVVSVTPGGATWLPGKTPSNGGQFVGITSATSSMTIAKITLKGTSAGSGSVSVSGVKLARSGTLVGTSGSGTSFTIQRALVPASAVSVASSSHPDQAAAYTATTIALSWNKAAGVTGFSYLLDQDAATVPAAKAVDVATSATYADKAIGTYYFHIRAQNGDGWSGTTHFKITIKEPDPVIDTTLATPVITSLEKAAGFTTDLTKGTVSGIILKGTGLVGYTTNITVTPAITLAEGQSWSVANGSDGKWELTTTAPIPSGFYTFTVQAIKGKTLTPVSKAVSYEIGVSEGGTLHLVTATDAVSTATPTPSASATPNPGASRAISRSGMTYIGLGTAAIILIGALGIVLYKRRVRP